MSRPPRLSALFAVCWLGVVCATPPLPPPLVQKQGVAATAQILTPGGARPALPLSDQGTVRLRVEAPAPLEVEVTEEPKATPHWKLEAKGPPSLRAPKGAGMAVWEQDYVLDPLQPGRQSVELPPLRYRTGGEGWHKVVWQPVPVEITTSIKKVEPGSARDITSIETVPGDAGGHDWLAWAGAALGAVLLALLVWAVRRRRAVKPAPPPAHAWALRELEGLAARHPQTGEEVEAYHTALSAVLRRYLERRFQIPAERQTTAEFLAAVRKSSELSAEQQAALGELLTHCDLAKFARVWPSAEECQGLVTRARALVEETAPKAPD